VCGVSAVAGVPAVYAYTLAAPHNIGLDTTIIDDWLPVIVEFAMLGMVMGLLKKFGKW
jgi:hypothetical protein